MGNWRPWEGVPPCKWVEETRYAVPTSTFCCWWPFSYTWAGYSLSQDDPFWRVTTANENYECCQLYSNQLIIPSTVTDEVRFLATTLLFSLLCLIKQDLSIISEQYPRGQFPLYSWGQWDNSKSNYGSILLRGYRPIARDVEKGMDARDGNSLCRVYWLLLGATRSLSDPSLSYEQISGLWRIINMTSVCAVVFFQPSTYS